MYTSQENVRIAIATLKQYNVRKVVVSPGGTNIPVVQAVQQDSFFECYSVYDERSAIYFAIGLYLQSGEPIAASCTSAQATRNYVPGLTEAFYKHAPIIALTTAKQKRFEYQDYMQAPDQCSLPNDCVKKSFDLPPVTDENTRAQCHQYARNAILEAFHGTPGPVQLNLRMVDTQLSLFEAKELPRVTYTKRYMVWDDWSDVDLLNKKILVVIGEHRVFNDRQLSAFDKFSKSYNVAIYTNNLSNYHGEYSFQGNLLVTGGGLSLANPDIVISIGGQTGDYSIFRALNNLCSIEHWRVSEDGNPVDSYNKLTKIFECPDFYLFEKLSKDAVSDHEYFEELINLQNKLVFDIEIPFSNVYTAQQLYKEIPANSIMNFAIHNSLRCWNYFPLDKSICCYSNVAAFGIDGCNSMLIGESMLTEDLCFIVTGDLAFFYDMNSLGIRHIKNNIRILLINNSYGVEFALLTNNFKESIPIDEFVAAKGHNASAKGWAESCGFQYLSASNKEEFSDVKQAFISKSDKPIILEVFTNGEDETKALSIFRQTNKLTTSASKKAIKKLIGSENLSKIKNILKNNK